MTLPASIRIACASANWLCVRQARNHHGGLFFVLSAPLGLSGQPSLLTNLFSEVLPTPEASVTRAPELADEVAKNTSTVSTKLMRDLMYHGANSAEAAHLLDSRVIFGLFGSKDNDEGVKSFFEKRPPNFQGKDTG